MITKDLRLYLARILAITGSAVCGRACAATRVLRAAGAGGGAGPARLRDRARDGGRAGRGGAHRGRGVRGIGRPGLARLPGPHRAQCGHVRAARPCVRLLHLWHAFLRQPGLPAGRHGVRRAAPGRPGRRRDPAGRAPPVGCSRSADAARARRRVAVGERDLARGPARLCQALGIDRALDGADVCGPGSPLRASGPGRPAGGRSAPGPASGSVVAPGAPGDSG